MEEVRQDRQGTEQEGREGGRGAEEDGQGNLGGEDEYLKN